MHGVIYTLVFNLVLVFGIHATTSPLSCRCLAFHDCWPTSRIWKHFNSSVEGRLIRVLPPAAPCHDPFFDQEACTVAKQKWDLEFWRTEQPGGLYASNFENSGNRGCSIYSNRSSTCYQGGVPVYAVSALTAEHIQSSVKFARKHNLRLVVKNTGHDPNGRSTAPGSFAIWLHHLKNVSFHDNFVPKGCAMESNTKIPAVTVGAGVQWDELYAAAHEHKVVITGGGCPSVGAAGAFPQAGGHSILSPLYGLAADNILQYEVVTADGKHLVANNWQNQELFWALRGGGGGTFGVVVSATYRTHPPLENAVFTLFNVTTNLTYDNGGFRNLVTRFTLLSPMLSDAGWSGYVTLSNQSFVMSFLLPNKNVSFAKETLAPLTNYAAQQSGLIAQSSWFSFPSFQEWRLALQCRGQSSCVNVSARDKLRFPGASRLIPRNLFQQEYSASKISQAVIDIVFKTQFSATIIADIGGDVTRPRQNSVNPALRSALWHVLLTTDTNDNTTQAEYNEASVQITQANKLLVDITPGSGAYMNEADFNELQWQESFFGEHYPRLLELKAKYDPTGLFVCHHCVGSERWSNDLNCPNY